VHNASVTKNMTLLLAVEAILSPFQSVATDDMVVISELAGTTGGSMMEPNLFPGDVMPLGLLMYGMMLQSGNRASVAIAEHIASSATNFVRLMNQRAAELGMTRTIYGHPAGGCVSPPEDQLRLWNFARQYPLFREFTTATNFMGCGLFANSDIPKCYNQPKLATSNPPYPGLGGWKGGNGWLWWFNGDMNWTDAHAPAATSSLVSETTRLGRNLQVCIQQTGSRWGDHNRLMDYGYQKIFTPDFRSVAQALAIPSTNDFALTAVGGELAVFAFVQGTRVRISSFGINGEPRFDTFQFPQSHTIDDLPEGMRRLPASNIDAALLAPNPDAIADVVTARHDATGLRLELWRLGQN
jgi:D-alanyl-D-alanine carboxypeptidase